MFSESELRIILSSLENSRRTIGVSCIFCELEENREEYATTKYCGKNCIVGKKCEEMDSLIFKLKKALK